MKAETVADIEATPKPDTEEAETETKTSEEPPAAAADETKEEEEEAAKVDETQPTPDADVAPAADETPTEPQVFDFFNQGLIFDVYSVTKRNLKLGYCLKDNIWHQIYNVPGLYYIIIASIHFWYYVDMHPYFKNQDLWIKTNLWKFQLISLFCYEKKNSYIEFLSSDYRQLFGNIWKLFHYAY